MSSAQPPAAELQPEVSATGGPGAWVLRSPDGRRVSEPLDDATARDYCARLGVAFPGNQQDSPVPGRLVRGGRR